MNCQVQGSRFRPGLDKVPLASSRAALRGWQILRPLRGCQRAGASFSCAPDRGALSVVTHPSDEGAEGKARKIQSMYTDFHCPGLQSAPGSQSGGECLTSGISVRFRKQVRYKRSSVTQYSTLVSPLFTGSVRPCGVRSLKKAQVLLWTPPMVRKCLSGRRVLLPGGEAVCPPGRACPGP